MDDNIEFAHIYRATRELVNELEDEYDVVFYSGFVGCDECGTSMVMVAPFWRLDIFACSMCGIPLDIMLEE